jgi:hypothetical protein
MSGCDLNEFIKTNRMLVAALVGEGPLDLTDPAILSPDTVDYSLTGLVPNLNKYLIHLEALGAIPGSGDTIQVSLQKLVQVSGWTPDTVDEMIAQIQALDPGLLDTFSDLANLLIAYKSIFPGTTNVHIVKSFYESWSRKRYEHNELSLLAYQATALRGIQRSLAPFDDGVGEENEADLINSIFSIPFLSKALVAVLEPSPLGEITIMGSYLPDIVKSTFSVITSAWDRWWNKWINRVETPVPLDTVTGNLTAIADAIGNIEPGTEQEADESGIEAGLAVLGTVLAGLGTGQLAGIKAAIEEIDAQVNVDVECSTCGSSGGCGCGAGSGIPDTGDFLQPDPASGQGNGNPLDPGPGGGGVPTGFSGTPSEYSAYKCKASNYVYDAVYAGMNVLGGMSTGAAAIAAGTALGGWMLANLVASGAAFTTAGGVVIFSFVAGWEIAAFIAVIAVVSAIAGGGVLYAFYDLATEIDSVKSQIICELYTAQTVEDAQTVMGDAIATAITDMVITPPYDAFDTAIRSAFSNAANIFIPNSLYNKLFEQDTAVSNYTATETCIDCCSHYIPVGSAPYGTLVSDINGTIMMDANFADAVYRVQIDLNVGCDPSTLSNVNVTSGVVQNATPNWRLYSDAGLTNPTGDIYNSDALPAGTYYNVREIAVTSDSAFSIQFDYEEYVP